MKPKFFTVKIENEDTAPWCHTGDTVTVKAIRHMVPLKKFYFCKLYGIETFCKLTANPDNTITVEPIHWHGNAVTLPAHDKNLKILGVAMSRTADSRPQHPERW